ncbi:MAG: calcineurin-like phosphoesterase C-terminal domain-containing protein [Bacteroidales bacterium]|nr:calcineurin-like phosphoesterase C-terminal domain-containing protein [Candidatus Cryptobacteroides equifaecalis]
MKRLLKTTAILLSMTSLILSCRTEKDQPEPGPTPDARLVETVNLPRTIDAMRNSLVLVQGKGFRDEDRLRFSTADGKAFETAVCDPEYSQFSFRVGAEFVTGTSYAVTILRGEQKQKLGSTTVYVSEISDKCSVSGTVTCGGDPVQGVWVSDGKAWDRTDSEGKYYLKSDKRNGYVFMVIPGGYVPAEGGAFPQYWAATTSPASELEYHDFELKRTDNTKHRIVFTADWHISNYYTPKDYVQLEDYLADVLYMEKAVPTYSIPLGDLSWDIRWYSNNFDIVNWRNLMSTSPIPIFPVMGNHDYDFKGLNDFECAGAWRKCMGPTYYSMNLGQVHYVVLDNVIYNSDGTGQLRETVEELDATQLAWLKEDLSHVDKSTPVVVCAHVPMHSWDWTGSFWTASERGKNYSEYLRLLEDYRLVHIFSGHSHISEFFDVKAAGLARNSMYEHKLPALGGTIWYTRSVADFNLSIDGVSDGYELMDVEGTSLSCRFQAVGESSDFVMRVYDVSEMAKFWEADGKARNLAESVPDYSFANMYGQFKGNDVLINLFEASPVMKGTSLVVTENGRQLPVKAVYAHDPVHVLQSEAAAWAKYGSLPAASFQSKFPSHLFLVTPEKESTTLVITYTGVDGRIIEKNITLPKQFKNEDKL